MPVGRKPKPTNIRLLEGNPGKRAISQDGPNWGPLGEPPQEIIDFQPQQEAEPGVALAKWNELARVWGVVLTEGDREQFAEYCRLEAWRVLCQKKVFDEGLVYTTAAGQKVRSPWAVMLESVTKDQRRLASEFGATPASRARVKAAPEAPKSKFAGLTGAA